MKGSEMKEDGFSFRKSERRISSKSDRHGVDHAATGNEAREVRRFVRGNECQQEAEVGG